MNLQNYIQENNLDEVKLHLGCGHVKWLDYINIDLYPHDDSVIDSSRKGCIADVFADVRELGLPDNSVDAIFTSHTVEHLRKWDCIDTVRDWHRMLKPGGLLEVEMPDFNRCLILLFHPLKKKRMLGLNQFYGNQWDRLDYETHRYVWSAGEFRKMLLEEIGFSQVKVNHRAKTHKKFRDMHVEALK